LTRNTEKAKDLLQDVNVKLLKNNDMYHAKDDASYYNWACTVMRNEFIGQIRKRKIETFPIIDDIDFYETEKVKSYQNLSLAIRGIKNKKVKRIMFMRYLGVKYVDIADKMDIPLNTIKSDIKCGKEIIKNSITP
jgi:RNA polymerase sigma-70 factor (ECF subfamily)